MLDPVLPEYRYPYKYCAVIHPYRGAPQTDGTCCYLNGGLAAAEGLDARFRLFEIKLDVKSKTSSARSGTGPLSVDRKVDRGKKAQGGPGQESIENVIRR